MNVSTVVLLRHAIRITIRIFALAVAFVVLFRIADRLVLMTLAGGWGEFMARPVYNVKERFAYAFPWLGLALLLWLAENQLARLAVPWTGRRCVECGYELRNLKGNRCPECGAEVADTSK